MSASVTGTTPTYYLTDGLGSTSELANTSGNVTDAYRYDVFGALGSSTGSSAQPFRFTGEQRDSESSFYYLRARYYDPAVGRFLSQDPVFGTVPVGQSLDRYTYVVDNPVRFVDLTGLSREGPTPKPLRPPTPPCEAVPGATCCYTPDEPWGFICNPGPDPLSAALGAVADFLTSRTPACYIQVSLLGIWTTIDVAATPTGAPLWSAAAQSGLYQRLVVSAGISCSVAR